MLQLLGLTAMQSEVASASLSDAIVGSLLLSSRNGSTMRSLSVPVSAWDRGVVRAADASILGITRPDAQAGQILVAGAVAAVGVRLQVDPDSSYNGQSGMLAALSRPRLSETP